MRVKRRKVSFHVESLEPRLALSYWATPATVSTVESISVETTTQVSYPCITVAEYVEPVDFYA